MIRSIRQFLLISLLITITIASSTTAIGNYLLDKKVIQPYLDEKLIKFSLFLQSINQSIETESNIRGKIANYLENSALGFTPHLIFQILSKDKQIIFISLKN